ncbi:MAG TPA: hypothetical protein VF268_12120 [Gammaproteobacteria bacterium]
MFTNESWRGASMLNLVVALKAEAAPLIAHYGLRARAPKGLFALYESSHENDGVALVVSGVGKTAAAGAVTYLHAVTGEPQHAAWLNIGIAGHRDHALGTLWLAHKITDAAANRNWYPPQILASTLMSRELLCVDTPEAGYTGDALYDMEAAGFYAAACRCSTAELVQCLKIISDNAQSPANTPGNPLKARDVEALVAAQLPAITDYAEALEKLARQLQSRQLPDDELQPYLQHWHFTVTQRHQLKTLLQRRRALQPGQPLWREEYRQLPTGKQVLAAIQQQVDSLAVRFA